MTVNVKMKTATIADLKTVSKAIDKGESIIELFRTPNCPTLKDLVVGTTNASKVFNKKGKRNKIKMKEDELFFNMVGGVPLIEKIENEMKEMKKEIGMLGNPSAEATVHDIDESKSKYVTDRNIKTQLVMKVTLDEIDPNDKNNSFFNESLASFLVSKDDHMNFTKIHGSFICKNLGYMIMEKFDGSLPDFEKVMKRDVITKDIDNIYMQILASLYHIQKKHKMVHHDLHDQNIMIKKIKKSKDIKYNINGIEYNIKNRGFLVKIIDFGFAHYDYKGKRMSRSDVSNVDTNKTWGNRGTTFNKSYDVLFATVKLNQMITKYVRRDSKIFKAITLILSKTKFSQDINSLTPEQWSYTYNLRPYGKLPSSINPLRLIKMLYKDDKKELKASNTSCKDLKVNDLKERAKKENIKGRSKMNKKELCEKLGLK